MCAWQVLHLLTPTHTLGTHTHGKSTSKLCKVICQTLLLMGYTEGSVPQMGVCSFLCCLLCFPLRALHQHHCTITTPPAPSLFSLYLNKSHPAIKKGEHKENKVLRRGRWVVGWLGEKARSWVVEGLNESFIRSAEKGSRGRKRERGRERQGSRKKRRRRRLFKGEHSEFFWPIHRRRRSVAGSPGEPSLSPAERQEFGLV